MPPRSNRVKGIERVFSFDIARVFSFDVVVGVRHESNGDWAILERGGGCRGEIFHMGCCNGTRKE